MINPSELAGSPPADIEVPEGLRNMLHGIGLGDAHLRPVWLNGGGGLTFAIAGGGADSAANLYVKWNPASSGESLLDEAERLQWVQGRHPAPSVVEVISNETEEILLTRALPGESAVWGRWIDRPKTVLRALGEGLRQLHDVPLETCPFDWGVEPRVRSAQLDTRQLGTPPPIDELVLCQGDPCAPNTLLAADGSFLAHVDLARLGAADRWADLAVMSMSLEWNYRDYDESVFWEAYGIEPDPLRIRFYRKLWNAE